MQHTPTARRTIYNPDESGAVPIHDADSVDEVHAIDVDDTLNQGGDPSMEDCVQLILARCRTGVEDRLRYVIYERRIWEADNGWDQSDYTGSNPHDQHAHFSASYDSGREADTSSWGLVEEYGMALSDGDKDWIDARLNAYVGDVVDRWTSEGGRVPAEDENPQQTLASAAYYSGADGAYMRYQQLTALQESVDRLQATVDQLAASIGDTA